MRLLISTTAAAILLSLLFITSCENAPPSGSGEQVEPDSVRLVVGIVVDQMRHEYLERYSGLYGSDGFRRMLRDGYRFNNHHFNYFPTFTGPGHAAVYTGATPAVNGIVGNEWYDREARTSRYVVEDGEVGTVGAEGDAGEMSPANLQSTTIADELKSAHPESRVVGISMKDRGAVMGAGHLGDAAYWYDGETGRFVSSSWYMEELPGWVRQFNEEGLARAFSDSTWDLALEPSAYAVPRADDSPYEGTFPGEETPVFPHRMGGDLGRIDTSPFGNTLVGELARRAVDAENLGADDVPDFLGISYSATDYVGHQFGPRSLELADTYLRLDRELAELLDYLDEEVGEDSYLVFLTSDHGVADVPAELADRGLPGGRFDRSAALSSLRAYLEREFDSGARIEAYMNQQIYFDRQRARDNGVDLGEMQRAAARFLLQFEGVQSAVGAEVYRQNDFGDGMQAYYDRGFHARRSGDVFIHLRPGWLDSEYTTGTTHGSPYSYDTHVPMLWMGPGISPGSTDRRTVIPQIAPTLSAMLDIPFTSGTDASVLKFE